MKNTLFILLLTVCSMSASAQSGNQILGEWYTKDQNSIVAFTHHDAHNEYTGKLVWIKEPENKSLVGKTMIKELSYFSENGYYIGEVYLPRRNTYKECKVQIKGDKLILHVKSGWMSRSVEWHRKKPDLGISISVDEDEKKQ